MNISLEELRAQRALLKQQLDWLDQKIASADRPSKTQDITPSDIDAALNQATAAATAPPPPPTAPSPATSSVDPIIALNEDRIMAPSVPKDAFRAKIGCVVFFILAAGLFIFLLFGLPYLID